MRIGVDAGRENVLVRTYMQQKRHDVNGSVLVGKSCQNQRIERMWVDNWNNVTHVYHDIFVLTEPKHMWALHYVFIALQGWIMRWKSSQCNGTVTGCPQSHKTPINLFFTGVLTAASGSSVAIRELLMKVYQEMLKRSVGMMQVKVYTDWRPVWWNQTGCRPSWKIVRSISWRDTVQKSCVHVVGQCKSISSCTVLKLSLLKWQVLHGYEHTPTNYFYFLFRSCKITDK